MIQRIQTVYLTLAVSAFIGLLFTGAVWSGKAALAYAWFTPVVLGLGGVTVALAVLSIFLFKNSPKQRQVIVMAQVLTVLFLVAFFGGLFLADALYVRTTEGMDLMMLITLLLPLLGYLFLLLARRAVSKDIELVRSVDRLRD